MAQFVKKASPKFLLSISRDTPLLTSNTSTNYLQLSNKYLWRYLPLSIPTAKKVQLSYQGYPLRYYSQALLTQLSYIYQSFNITYWGLLSVSAFLQSLPPQLIIFNPHSQSAPLTLIRVAQPSSSSGIPTKIILPKVSQSSIWHAWYYLCNAWVEYVWKAFTTLSFSHSHSHYVWKLSWLMRERMCVYFSEIKRKRKRERERERECVCVWERERKK